jgi:NADPH2:quinone reductase
MPDGRRVYFVLPDPPFGAMAERVAVRMDQCAMVPEGLDDVTAAAIANPGMSSWAALCERAHLVPGETVLINGATGTSGRLAVRIAKHLGAKKVVALGRNADALRACAALGADETISLLAPPEALGAALAAQFRAGVDVVVDYLYGESAAHIIAAVAAGDPQRAVRFVQVGSASGGTIALPAHALRATGLSLLGSGIGSVALPALLRSIEGVFAAAAQGVLSIETRVEPLRAVAAAWRANEETARTVFTID